MTNTRITVSTLRCPTCGATEMHPDGENLLIRGFKVHTGGRWWSQCLVCAGYYNPDLTGLAVSQDGINPDYNRKAGWF